MNQRLMRNVALFTFVFYWLSPALSQSALPSPTVEHVIIVTTDGLRWQEIFQGADSLCIQQIKSGETQEHIKARFLPGSSWQNRKALLPFLWGNFAQKGRLYGNRNYHNKINVSNNIHISYPGYSEMFCGFTDDKRILTNGKKHNPNHHVLEWINAQPGFENEVAVVGSWALFPWIFNQKRAHISMNAGFEPFSGAHISNEQQALNAALRTCARPWKNHVRPDTLTWAFAKNILDEQAPKVLFIGYGETDEYGHEGDYAGYLDAAHRFDSLLQVLWNYVENSPKYRGKTAILISTDHGRGSHNWKSHNMLTPGSDETWMAAFIPGMEAPGEVKSSDQLHQAQLAQTIAHALGLHYENPERAVAPAIYDLWVNPPTAIRVPAADFILSSGEVEK